MPSIDTSHLYTYQDETIVGLLNEDTCLTIILLSLYYIDPNFVGYHNSKNGKPQEDFHWSNIIKIA